MEKQFDRLTAVTVEVPYGSQEEIGALAAKLLQEGSCLAGLTVVCYSCLILSWATYNHWALNRVANVAVKLFAWTTGCFEVGDTSWGITTGQMWRHLSGAISGVAIDWSNRPLHVCMDESSMHEDSLIGYCGSQIARDVEPAIASPAQPIRPEDVVLCTHTTADALSQVESMLRSWRGAASVAVYDSTTIQQARPAVLKWSRRLRRLGIRKVVVSLVGPSRILSKDYDTLYPANLLRQVAVDAAVADLVLLVDPGFVPSAGFRGLVSPSAPLGAALRKVLEAAPAAFLVTSFLTFGNPSGNGTEDLSLLGLRRLIDAGDAIAFEAHVCPACRPYAWQWMLLTEPSSLRFREVEQGDLYHPFWLASRSALPRLPGFFHGLVGPRSGTDRIGWTGLPSGLKASAEQLRAAGVRTLLLPEAFVHRHEGLPMPGHHWEHMPTGLPYQVWEYYFDVLFQRFLLSLPRAQGGGRGSGGALGMLPRSFFSGRRLVEVLPPRALSLTTLQTGSDPGLQLIVMASTILGSEGLELLLSSVPWTVYAVCLGAKRYWACALEELPVILRSFPRDAIVAIVDAYDVVYFPCSRSIIEEYRAYGREVVWAADTTCFPNRQVCKTCEARYGRDSPELEACRKFPNLNGGCYMGTPAALADSLDWMREQGKSIGTDDQENKWHVYNRFPERIVLDHRQRIFTCFFGCARERFRVENCTVVSEYTGQEVCFAHANGGTKWEILAPLLQELEEQGCREHKQLRHQSARHYAGMATPRMIWW